MTLRPVPGGERRRPSPQGVAQAGGHHAANHKPKFCSRQSHVELNDEAVRNTLNDSKNYLVIF